MCVSAPPATTEPLSDAELTALALLWGETEPQSLRGFGPDLVCAFEKDTENARVLWGAIPLLIDEVGRLRGVESYLRAKLAEREELL